MISRSLGSTASSVGAVSRRCGGPTPFLILTGRGAPKRQERRARQRVDDYLTQAFHLRESVCAHESDAQTTGTSLTTPCVLWTWRWIRIFRAHRKGGGRGPPGAAGMCRLLEFLTSPHVTSFFRCEALLDEFGQPVSDAVLRKVCEHFIKK